jgi:hypothetical protein
LNNVKAFGSLKRGTRGNKGGRKQDKGKKNNGKESERKNKRKILKTKYERKG